MKENRRRDDKQYYDSFGADYAKKWTLQESFFNHDSPQK
jgi:hypothetical protein